MRIAFYAPLKPPDHPVPSGDRRMARLLIAALQQAGHEVEIVSHFCSRDGEGDPARQARLAATGEQLARRLQRRFATRPEGARPEAWLTYHLYYKAPDYLGPAVCSASGLPYLVAEASVAPKRAGGPWDRGHRQTLQALEMARAVITLNPADRDCLPDPARAVLVKPFLKTASYGAAAAARQKHRQTLAAQQQLDPQQAWLLVAAMMRPGDKLESYRLLAQALVPISDRPWQLLVAGDGPERAAVEAALAPLGQDRLRFLGTQSEAALPALYAAADLLVWPAVREAYGMALLEAQASGLPVVAGDEGGVSAIVADGISGLLTAPRQAAPLAAAIAALIGDPERRAAMGAAALAKVQREHDLAVASRQLDAIFMAAVSSP